MASSSSLAPFVNEWKKYDVFLSFRGKDTRNNFTDSLYHALSRKNIFTFRDEERLKRGKEISSELLRAIEESMLSVIILSENYASSTWCLDELAKILECNEMKKDAVLPVFYEVDPSDVRKQKGNFKKAFDKHEGNFRENMEKVERWRSALTQVANLSGWHVKDRHESEVIIQKLVIEISRKLGVAFLSSAKDLVGIASRVREMKAYLKPQHDVRFVGMWGVCGIGKSTIARVVYDWLSDQYEGSCFLENIRDVSETRGLVPLQEQLLYEVLAGKKLNILHVQDGVTLIRKLLSGKKIFIVLDDVDQLEQLKALAKVPEWFGSGSIIIITTRNGHLLINHGVQYIYKVGGLNHDEAMELFHLKAF